MATAHSSPHVHDQAWAHQFIRQTGRPPTPEERDGVLEPVPSAVWHLSTRVRRFLARALARP